MKLKVTRKGVFQGPADKQEAVPVGDIITVTGDEIPAYLVGKCERVDAPVAGDIVANPAGDQGPDDDDQGSDDDQRAKWGARYEKLFGKPPAKKMKTENVQKAVEDEEKRLAEEANGGSDNT